MGHEHALSQPRPSVRCRFSQRTFAQRRWGVGEAPTAAVPRPPWRPAIRPFCRHSHRNLHRLNPSDS